MKALMKGDAAVYFKKKEKQIENIQDVMNEIQAKIISKFIGISESQIDQFQNFFQYIRKIKFPKEIRRFPNADKTKVIYQNQITGEETDVHPDINLIKIAFYETIINDKSVYTFNSKQNKLLPYVEQKMIKQSFGLNSKRRQAQKVNLQRDQNGKMVLSKMARLTPDLRRLISSRSYMLKLLVEKIYTKKQLWGKGKRANTYASILAQKLSGPDRQDEEEETQESLEKYQTIFDESKRYYEKQFGNLNFIPLPLTKTKQYLKGTPESMLRNVFLLNIDKANLEFYWFARLMECLPLPQNWVLKFGNGFDEYYYEPLKLTFDLHPSYIYILQLMNRFRSVFSQMDPIHQNYYTSMRQMVFFDFFERPYKVDMYGFIDKSDTGALTKKKVIKQSQQLGSNDWMAMEAIRNSDIIDSQLVLVQQFLKYWGGLNYKQELYLPAVSPFGQVVWSSNITKKSVEFCPHERELKKLVKQKSKDLSEVYDFDLKTDFKNEEDLQIQKKVEEERVQFLHHFILNDPKPLSQPFCFPETSKQQEFYEQIFVSPFDLQININYSSEEQKPIWLQKVHAKKQIAKYITILNHHPSEYENLKRKFIEYGIEMMKKHEPNRQQQLMIMINGIQNVEDFKKFIRHVNDIDAREQRKKLQNIGIVKEQDDFLGSSISQIDMEEQKNDEEQESQDQIQQSSSSQTVKQPEIDDLSSQDQKKQPSIDSSEKQESEEKFENIKEEYKGIIYQKSQQLDQLNDEELDAQIKLIKKQKTLKHKFSKSQIRQEIKNIQGSFSNDVKKNLITSELKSFHAPYKISPQKVAPIKRENWTPAGIPDFSEQFTPYRSQASSYGNDSLIADIQKWKERDLTISQSDENFSESEDQKKVIDDTRQTIQLQPIKRIKPDLNEDPILRHISKIKEVQGFKKSFKPTVSSSEIPKKPIDKKQRASFEFVKNKLKIQSKNPQILQNESSLKKSSSISQISYKSISPMKTSNFNRVCLTNTANSLLPTQPLTKKGDLMILQARKTLISKGRGLETFLSKNY